MEPLKRYQGRRNFSDPPTRRELEEFADAVARSLDAVDGSRTWSMLPVARASSATGFGACLPVDTSDGGTIDVALPIADARRGGQEAAIIRRSALGTVRVIPPSGATLDGAGTVATLPATAGWYVFGFDGANFWTEP